MQALCAGVDLIPDRVCPQAFEQDNRLLDEFGSLIFLNEPGTQRCCVQHLLKTCLPRKAPAFKRFMYHDPQNFPDMRAILVEPPPA